jgi:hypothetical protein
MCEKQGDVRTATEAAMPKPVVDGQYPLMSQLAIMPWNVTQDGVNNGFIEHVMIVPRAQWEAAKEGRCVVCGCTELRACAGGCAWREPGLCTSCAPDEFQIDFEDASTEHV